MWERATTLASLLQAAVFLLAPSAMAGSDGEGSFEDPQILDPMDDIGYDPLYTGPKPANDIDLLRGWVHYDNVADEIGFTFHMVDTQGWSEADAYALQGFFSAGGEGGGQSTGTFVFRWIREFDASNIQYAASFERSGSTSGLNLTVRGEVDGKQPGNITLWVDAPGAALLADRLTNLSVQFFKTARYEIPGGPGMERSIVDRAEAADGYTLPRRVSLNAGERVDAPAQENERGASASTSTPNWGLAPLLLVIAGAAFWRQQANARR